MLVVFDTNVVVSALLSPYGRPAALFRRIGSGTLKPCCDERILAEYETVLRREKFGFSNEYVDVIMAFLRTHCLLVTPVSMQIEFVDESDKKFYEVAKFCNAILITGNRKHFPDDPIVKSVNEIE